MMVIKKKVTGAKADISSANDIIHITLDSNCGPLLELEDGSTIVFARIEGYFDLLNNTSIYNILQDTFDVDLFRKDYMVQSDDLKNGTIYMNTIYDFVEEYHIRHDKTKVAYRLF